MAGESLVNEQIEAGLRFVHEFDKRIPVRVAFWLKDRERWFWHLCIVSDEIPGEKVYEAYGEVGRVADQMPDPDFNSLRVSILGWETPVARAALEAQQRYRGKRMIHLHDTHFGDVSAEEVLIYPQAMMPAPAQ
jgi:hypothetical protein